VTRSCLALLEEFLSYTIGAITCRRETTGSSNAENPYNINLKLCLSLAWAVY
jgi:hypothetical protein